MIATLNALDGQMHKLRTHVSSVQRSKRSILSRLLYPAASYMSTFNEGNTIEAALREVAVGYSAVELGLRPRPRLAA